MEQLPAIGVKRTLYYDALGRNDFMGCTQSTTTCCEGANRYCRKMDSKVADGQSTIIILLAKIMILKMIG